ncbi:MAG: SUMF1/EgtB/PvdO family nonheme iron enzyme [Fibrobacteres bacterium]|nr:SUMF1/EgtB/PvdO family nonheme iron enzyme [Fibrobacterota bacterium]
MRFFYTIVITLLHTTLLFAKIPQTTSFTNSNGITFVRIAADSFEMGNEGRALGTHIALTEYIKYGIHNEFPKHKVHLDTFFMGKNEITIGQFKIFNPSIMARYGLYDPKSDSIPVYAISWFEADSFCKWLTTNDPDGYTYRLPTEAEWEYACRGKSTTWYYSGDTLHQSVGNISLSSGLKKIALYPPNPFGLNDMCGNVREWCFDWMAPYQFASLSNPGGSLTGHLKSVRSIADNSLFARTVSRGSLPAVANNKLTGFRVVISKLSPADLSYTASSPNEEYQKNVSPARPAPLSPVIGERFTNSDGREFKRVRLTNELFPTQEDSVVYVSLQPLQGDSASSRYLAGQYAKSLSLKNGVLYRISNKYELKCANISSSAKEVYLTIFPDIRYPGWQDGAHSDVSYFKWRVLPVVDSTYGIGGPLYHKCNHAPQLSEAPNGDILIGFFSGISEDNGERVMGISRLRLGDTNWDNSSSYHDVAGWRELGGFFNNTYGELVHISITAFGGFQSNPNTFLRKSNDNGVTYGNWSAQSIYNFPFSMYRMGSDTLISMGMYHKRLHVSTDSGLTWSEFGSASVPGINKSMVITDSGIVRVYVRPDMGSGAIKNSDSIATMAQYITNNKGNSYTARPTPFPVQGIGVYDLPLKLHSGRMIMVTRSPDNKTIIAESIDNGETWFCRRKLTMTKGIDYMGFHKGLTQGRDGLIHVVGAPGSCGFQPGDIPHIAFSEQWLREGSCLDIADWGINTAGMIAPCPHEDSLPLSVTAYKNNKVPILMAVPNPFNPSTLIKCDLPKGMVADYTIYSMNGSIVFKHENLNNKVRIIWKGQASGLYIGKLKTKGGIVLEHKLYLTK